MMKEKKKKKKKISFNMQASFHYNCRKLNTKIPSPK